MSSYHTKGVSLAQRKLEKIISNYKTHLQAYSTVNGLFQERLFEIKADLDNWERFHHFNTVDRGYEKDIFEVMSHVFACRERCKNIGQNLSSVYEQMMHALQGTTPPPSAEVAPSTVKRDIDSQTLECDCDCTEK